MRRAAIVALGAIAVGVVGLVLAAMLHHTSRAGTLGVHAAAPVAKLNAGDTVCQRPIDVAEGAEFDVVDTSIGTYGKRGSPLLMTVDDVGGRRLASARIAGGYPDIGTQQVHRARLDATVTAPRRISVCVHNLGRRPVALYGDVDFAARGSTAYVNGRPIGFDVVLDFEGRSHSMASLVPRMLSRAALFRFAGLGTWVYVVLIALLLVGAPWLLVRALRGAERALTPSGEARRPRPGPS